MILCSLDQILKILNCSGFVCKVSFKNGLRVDFIKTPRVHLQNDAHNTYWTTG
jgi:hypothetical protein